MKGQMNRTNLRRTPKVFGTSYRPASSPTKRHSPTVTLKHWKPILIIIGIAVLGSLVARLPFFQIQTVTISGVTNQELISELEALKGKSIFSSQITRTTTKWLSRDQSLSELTCRRGLPDAVTCSGKNREGVLIWRQTDGEFWVDVSGRVFAERQPTDATALVVEDRLGQVKTGIDVASREIIETYTRLNQQLTERSIGVKHFIVVDALYQPTVVISSFPGPGGAIIQKELAVQFAATESIAAQVKTLASLLGQRAERVATRIDLRVPGYVYYN
jgi:cell division septal protein FtsQ